MVRVISVHNFLGQNVTQIEEPTAVCTANTLGHEMLLLALPTHCVEVHKLMTSEFKLLTIFPTVDMAIQMQHCTKGDYVATLETKISRDGINVSNFVRIYVNWAMVEGQGQAMRARIAGRVTPSLNRPLNSLEMIELPLSAQPTMIACCQTTGNLLVATGNSAILHEFKIETQQPSKLKFIDFEARPWSLGFSFSPMHMEIVEDFISIMDSLHFLVFQLINPMYEDIDQLNSAASTNSFSVDKTSVSTDSSLVDNTESSTRHDYNIEKPNYKPGLKSIEQGLDFIGLEFNGSTDVNAKGNTDRNLNPNKLFQSRSKVGKTKSTVRKPSYVDWDRLIHDGKEEAQRLVAQGIIDPSSLPLTINLPSISLERAGPGHTLSPFILNPVDMDVVIKTTSPDDGWSENYAVKNLLCLKISKINESLNIDGSSEYFTCSALKPLYLKKECNSSCLKRSILKSDAYKYLHGVTCLICTTQEGYIYHFAVGNNEESNPTCLTTYPFTAPVRHVALEHTILHALTEAGLESYTLRLSHHVATTLSRVNDSKIICPSISEPVCLIGLRPFLGMQTLLHAKSYIVLLAKAENSWTLYSLILPSPENIYFDMLNAAENHKISSPNTYRHLLGEAHAILRLAKEANYYVLDNVKGDNIQDRKDFRLENMYSQSCALLADYYINSDLESEWSLCIPYYKMSGLKAEEVLLRNSTANAPGLVTFLTETLVTMKSGSEADALFQGHNVVEILSSKNIKHLSKLVLGSPVLREYATEKLINLLATQKFSDSIQLALVLLYLQAERQDRAEKVLEPISEQFIKKTILEYWHLLFDATAIKKRSRKIPTFSEFSGALMRRKNRIFSEILSQLIEDDVLSLHQIIQVFLEYLPSRVGRDGHDAAAALQIFIEIYLQNYFHGKSNESCTRLNDEVCYDFAMVEAFKILVRSYLGNLTQTNIYKTEQNIKDCNRNNEEVYLFANFRPRYLDKMPPYTKDYQKILNVVDLKDLADLRKSENEQVVRSEVFKLQALLASGFLPVECLQEVKHFLESQDINGSLAFRTLCSEDTEVVTRMLMDDCPQAALQYAKDKYTKESEWKCFIELLQSKISTINEDQESQYYFFDQIMKETLTYLAQTLPLKGLRRILPKDDRVTFQKYIEICGQIVHADHVKSLIIKTGHQLLSTLNL